MPSHKYIISSIAYPGMVVDLSGSDNQSVILYQASGSDNQQWFLNQATGQSFTITSVRLPALGLQPVPLAANSPVIASNSPVEWETRKGSTKEGWNIVLVNRASGELLYLTATDSTPSTQLRILPSNGRPGQEWSFK